MAEEKKKLSIRQKLKKLFTSSIIYRPKGKNGTVIIDPSKLQSSGAHSATKPADKYKRLYRNATGFDISGSGGSSSLTDFSNILANRITLYSDYELMDTYSLISSALDIYADECTTTNEKGEIISIDTDDDEIKEILTNLFYDILDLEFNLWVWIRTAVKYGDMYLGMNVQDELGVIGVVPLSSYYMIRKEGTDDNAYDVTFDLINPELTNVNAHRNRSAYSNLADNGIDELENFEVAHFRMMSDTNFLPYGKSMIEGVRKDFKILMLMEDAMMLHRIMRSPEKRLFKVDIGNIPATEVDAFMEKFVTSMAKIAHIDETTGEYNLRYNMENMLEDFYLPVRGQNTGTSVETLPGLEYAPTEDLEFIQNKIFAGLKIPKAFLGFDGDVSGKSTLAQEDVRFARTIDRVQKQIVSELNKMAVVHLYAMGIQDERVANFKLSLTNPSLVYQQEKIEMFSQKVSLASDMKDLKMISRDFIYRNVFMLSESEAEEEAKKSLEDIKTIFREAQIENEGNDPAITKESVGTAWDIANLHTKSRMIDEDEDAKSKDKGGSEKGGQPGAGRPKESGKYGKDKSAHGRDPIAKKDLIQKTFDYDDKINHKYKGGSPLAFENIKSLKDLLDFE